MSDPPVPPADPDGVGKPVATTETPAEYIPAQAQAIEKLPKETRELFTIFAAFFRSTTGPDPETAKAISQTEMHQETCRLDAYKESLRTRDKQDERNHDFRKKKLNHETFKSVVVAAVAVAAIIVGLYLLVAKNDEKIGTPILVAGFMTLLTGKSILSKDKD
jgi:hypothetical protein